MTCYQSPAPTHTPWHFRPFITRPQYIFYSSLITSLPAHLSQIITQTIVCSILFCLQFCSLQLKFPILNFTIWKFNSYFKNQLIFSRPNILSPSTDFQEYFDFLFYSALQYTTSLILSKYPKLKKFWAMDL